MGADFIVLAVEHPSNYGLVTLEAAQAYAKSAIGAASAEFLLAVLENARNQDVMEVQEAGEFTGLWDEDGGQIEDPTPEAVAALRAYVAEEVGTILADLWAEPRDVTTLTLCGRTYWLAGGSTWGDDPSEAFTSLSLLANLGIFDPPERDSEDLRVVVEQARVHLSQPKPPYMSEGWAEYREQSDILLRRMLSAIPPTLPS